MAFLAAVPELLAGGEAAAGGAAAAEGGAAAGESSGGSNLLGKLGRSAVTHSGGEDDSRGGGSESRLGSFSLGQQDAAMSSEAQREVHG